MENIDDLLLQKDKMLTQIKVIEENCEGIDNVKKITELNVKKSELLVKKNSISIELRKIEQEINKVSEEIKNLSGTGIDRILEAIKEQRWYFFKNKPKVLMDKFTGILWTNLDYFKYKKGENGAYSTSGCEQIVKETKLDGYKIWELPTFEDFKYMIKDKTFPFKKGEYYYIMDYRYWYCNMEGLSGEGINLKDLTVANGAATILPCCKTLTCEDYKNNISHNNKVYSEIERLQFTLNLFVDNNLEPIFNNSEITELYKKIYIEKPLLLERLNELQEQINSMQQEVLLSSTFNYNILLAKYNINEINNSVIKYYKAIISWIDELMDKMNYYEDVKSDVIRECNVMALVLSKKYEDNPNLSQEENELLKSRQLFFKKHFELGINSISSKLLSVKRQAESIEDRIEEINDGGNIIKELALLENESRASFSFIAENTANIIKNALVKIEYFERNKEFATMAVKVWSEWTEDYKVFKTTKKDELKNICEDDSIKEEIWETWYKDWDKSRFVIEKQLLPLIKKGLKSELITNKLQVNDGTKQENIINRLIELLKNYKEKIDDFYIEERKGIYQKFAFQVGGDLQEKFESESQLYKITFNFQKQLQEVIFSLDKVEDKIFLLDWANNIVDLQIDEILYFIKDKDSNKISMNILKGFVDLKRKNYDIYISDTKAYAKELSRREKEYNSLMFKMRKDLMKN